MNENISIPMDEMDDGDDIEDEEYLDELGVEQSTPEKRARHAITGRGVTLQMLMADGIIKAGEAVLSLEYLGQKFTADLLANGKIKSNETDKIFGSPSSWAIFCKKLVNPAKKSGCGWASVKYKGRKLDSWKTSWFRQQKPRKPHIPGSQSPASSVSSETTDVYQKQCAVDDTSSLSTDVHQKPDDTSSINSEFTPGNAGLTTCNSAGNDLHTSGNDSTETTDTAVRSSGIDDELGVLDLTTKPKAIEQPPSKTIPESSSLCFMEEQEEALNLSLKAIPAKKTSEPKVVEIVESTDINKTDRTPIKHSCLPERSKHVDLNQLVSCAKFSSLGKAQPYTVSMATNSLLLMDFHCHLTTSEVVGYLGGKWDQSAQHLSVQQAFPCHCRLSDSQNATLIEEEIRSSMKHLGMSLVGWYHSHPYSLPEPSVRDLECQMSYQLKMKGAKSTYFPCVGMINSPYYSKSLKTESTVQMYMVMPPPESSNTDYGVPMALKYSVKQNHSVSEEILGEMKKLVDFYRGAPDWISFQHSWHPNVTYLEKMKTSLGNKLPKDQLDNGTFMDFIQHILTS